MELCELHQESQSLVAQHELGEARAKINQLLQRRPDFISALNNLNLIAMSEAMTRARSKWRASSSGKPSFGLKRKAR